MTPTETYLFLLADSFITGLVLPAKDALVFPAMQIFGTYNLYFAGLISVIGITLAAPLNWLLGRALNSLKKRVAEAQSNTTFEKVLSRLKMHGYWVGLLGFVPIIGPILTVFAGLVQTSLPRIIGLVFITNIIYYAIRAANTAY